MKKNNVPFVLIDRHYPDNESDYVIVDNFNGTKKATEHLFNLGRRHVGFVTLEPGLEAIKQRLLGYQEALRNNNIEPTEEFVKELGTMSYEVDMPSAINELLQGERPIDSIVFSTHYLTAIGLRVLKKLNIKIPQQIAIVSFDELSAFDLTDPPITSVIQPVVEIGNLAIDILINKIEGKTQGEFKKRILDTTFEIRRSCGAL